MIKRDWEYNLTTHTVVPTESLSFKSRLKSKYYNLDSKRLQYGWKRPEDEVLGPTILTTWSK